MPCICNDQDRQTRQSQRNPYETDTRREKEEENRETRQVDAYHRSTFSKTQLEKFFRQLGSISKEECCDYYERDGCDKEHICEFGLIVGGQQQANFVSDKSCPEPVEDSVETIQPLIPPGYPHPAGHANQREAVPEMMKMDSALRYNSGGKNSREQSRTEETHDKRQCRDESKPMPERASESRPRHVPKTR